MNSAPRELAEHPNTVYSAGAMKTMALNALTVLVMDLGYTNQNPCDKASPCRHQVLWESAAAVLGYKEFDRAWRKLSAELRSEQDATKRSSKDGTDITALALASTWQKHYPIQAVRKIGKTVVAQYAHKTNDKDGATLCGILGRMICMAVEDEYVTCPDCLSSMASTNSLKPVTSHQKADRAPIAAVGAGSGIDEFFHGCHTAFLWFGGSDMYSCHKFRYIDGILYTTADMPVGQQFTIGDASSKSRYVVTQHAVSWTPKGIWAYRCVAVPASNANLRTEEQLVAVRADAKASAGTAYFNDLKKETSIASAISYTPHKCDQCGWEGPVLNPNGLPSPCLGGGGCNGKMQPMTTEDVQAKTETGPACICPTPWNAHEPGCEWLKARKGK